VHTHHLVGRQAFAQQHLSDAFGDGDHACVEPVLALHPPARLGVVDPAAQDGRHAFEAGRQPAPQVAAAPAVQVHDVRALLADQRPQATDHAEAEQALAQGKVALITIDVLAPKLAYLLSLRRRLGVRNSTHTLVKIMQPFAGPALRLVSYTHPEYLELLGEYFTTAALPERGDAFLMRGTEGETVANANKAQQIDWFHGGLRSTLVPKQTQVGELPVLPAERDAETTAGWIRAVLAGEVPVPPSIAEQVAQCLLVSRTLRSRQRIQEPIV